MTLSDWIAKTGPKIVAKQLRVDPSTVCHWRTRKSFPRPRMLVKIHRLSQGKVTYAEMVNHFVAARK